MEELPAEERAILAAMSQGIRAALLRHKQAGNPVAVWRDGRVQWIPPDQIDLSVFDAPAAGNGENVTDEPSS